MSEAQIADLPAHGVLRPLMWTVPCPSCARPISAEAAFRCDYCHSLFHVRCLPAADQGGYCQMSTVCFLCAVNRGKVAMQKGDGRSLATSDLIEDVMGVCSVQQDLPHSSRSALTQD